MAAHPVFLPGGWQWPHLCPDAFTALAGRGWCVTERGQAPNASTEGRRAGRPGGGPLQPLRPARAGREAEWIRQLLMTSVLPHVMQGTLILKLHPEGRPCTCGLSCECVLEDRLKLSPVLHPLHELFQA